MPSTRNLTELVTDALRRADKLQQGVTPEFIETEDAEDLAQESLSSLWDMIRENGGEELLLKRATLAYDTDGIYLPSDFYKLVGLDTADGTEIRRLRPEDESRSAQFTGDRPRFYAIEGVATQETARLRLFPEATASTELALRYIPEPPVMADAVVSDPPIPEVGITLPNRWWRWISYDMAAEIFDREESHTEANARRKKRDEIGALIVKSSAATDYHEPAYIEDRRGILRRTGRRRRGCW